MAEGTHGVVVPAVPPRGPQLSLVASSVRPTDAGSDPAAPIFEVGPDQLALLPSELRDELAARKGEAWVRGIRYAPENQYAGVARDRCDFTTLDYPPLPAPQAPTGVSAAGGGTVPAELLEYAVTAVNGNGETIRSGILSITPGAIGTVTLSWNRVSDAAEYRVFRAKGGTKKPLRIKGGLVPAPAGSKTTVVSFIDTGEPEEAGKEPPAGNTTGGPGRYSNLPVVEYVPFLVLASDQCNGAGFQERDFKGRAKRLLDYVTPQTMELEFWNGALATAKSLPNNYLMKSGSVVDLTPGTAPSVERGFALLQDALATTPAAALAGLNGGGGQGMIHVQPQTVTNLTKVRRVGGMLYDIMDNIVVVGNGYPATGPGGVAPAAGNAWIGASDLVATRMEPEGTIFPDTLSEAFDWGQSGQPNTIRFVAQRFVAAYFDGARQFACEVKLPT